MRAQRNTTEAATAYLPAIEALRIDLASLEHETAQVRALLDGLERRAGIAGEPAAPPGDAAKPSGGKLRPVTMPAHSEDRTGTTKHATKPKTTAAPTKADDKAAASELATVVGTIVEAAELAAAASRDKDVKKLKAAVAAGERGERRAGELLVAMNGRVRPLPGEESAKRRWRAAVQLSAADFEKKVRRSQRRALAAIGVGPAPAKAKPSTRPQQAMKISPWTTDATGALTRTLTAEVDGAEAP